MVGIALSPLAACHYRCVCSFSLPLASLPVCCKQEGGPVRLILHEAASGIDMCVCGRIRVALSGSLHGLGFGIWGFSGLGFRIWSVWGVGFRV